MTPFTSSSQEQDVPLFSASFFIWVYHFYSDRIEIFRNFILCRKTVIYIDKIEMLMTENDPIFSHFGRCNLIVTFAGNVFTLFGLPKATLQQFSERYTQKENPVSASVRISTRSLLKKSALQTKWVWYLLINLIVWPVIVLMGSDYVDSENANALANFVFRHMLLAGTLVVSLGLPTALIWIWAFTGGFLMEFFKYYHYTATRRGELLYFEYGLLIRRQIYLDATRIAIVEFKQSPLMRTFGYGKLSIRAVGHNPIFFRSKLLIPFIHTSKLPDAMAHLFPTVKQVNLPPCKRSLPYNFFSRKYLVPFICAGIALVGSWEWLIVSAVSAVIVTGSIVLEYHNTGFWAIPNAAPHPLVFLSYGGYYRTAAWIDARRIEMIAVSGSRKKLQKGYLNIRVRVFGKSGTYALIRNVDASAVEAFKGLERS